MKVKVLAVAALVTLIVTFPLILKKSRPVQIGYETRLNPIDDNHLYDIEDLLS